MTVEEIETVDIDIDMTPDTHAVCCAADRFLCGAPYHPELDYTLTSESPTFTCKACSEIVRGMSCRQGLTPHFHCPLKVRKICPFTADGRRVREP